MKRATAKTPPKKAAPKAKAASGTRKTPKQSASKLIDARIKELNDWRGKTLASPGADQEGRSRRRRRVEMARRAGLVARRDHLHG